MNSDFFARQRKARGLTRWLLLGYLPLILLISFGFQLVTLLRFLAAPPPRDVLVRFVDTFSPSLAILGVIVGIALFAAWYLRGSSGGARVAIALGGIQVTSSDADPLCRQLHNVIEEMAVAAVIQKPLVFVLPQEHAINAFAAGNTRDTAAIAVTAGALRHLDRDQLQAVAAHEFSHILNGDMATNLHMASCLYGLTAVAEAGRYLLSQRDARGDRVVIFLVPGLAALLLGSVGVLACRVLQAGVSRQRERLADASAVQFTRNPQALRSAFTVMAAIATRIHAPTTFSTAHLFIGDPADGWFGRVTSSILATHPLMFERVRALSPAMTEKSFDADVRGHVRGMVVAEREMTEVSRSGGVWSSKPVAAPYSAIPPPATPTATRVSDPGESVLVTAPVTLTTALQMGALRGRTMAHVDTLHQRLPATTRQRMQAVSANASESRVKLQGIFVAALLAGDPTRQMAQLARIGPTLGLEVTRAARELGPTLEGVPPAARLPLLVGLLPALVGIDGDRQTKLRTVAHAFAPHVATGDWFRYAVTRILEPSILREHPQAKALPASAPLTERGPAAATLLLAMTQCRFESGDGGKAYRRGLVAVLPPAKWPPMSNVAVDAAALDAALAMLLDLSDAATKVVVEAMVAGIAETGVLNAAQVDLLRATCILLDVPMPYLPLDFRIEKDAI
ncbi:MAG: M48 family metalloprotease [Steroidobacteraceae bacterium]|nr:M48 family metalloprotease [Steroidobacteraceae bacterium]